MDCTSRPAFVPPFAVPIPRLDVTPLVTSITSQPDGVARWRAYCDVKRQLASMMAAGSTGYEWALRTIIDQAGM